MPSFNKTGPTEIKLPDDEPKIVWDSQLNKWVSTQPDDDDEQNQVIDQIRQGPPRIPMLSSNATPQQNRPPPQLMTQTSNLSTSNNLPASNLPGDGSQFSSGPPVVDSSQFSFMKRKQPRYVNILQQN